MERDVPPKLAEREGFSRARRSAKASAERGLRRRFAGVVVVTSRWRSEQPSPRVSPPATKYIGTWTGTWDGAGSGDFELTLDKAKDGTARRAASPSSPTAATTTPT